MIKAVFPAGFYSAEEPIPFTLFFGGEESSHNADLWDSWYKSTETIAGVFVTDGLIKVAQKRLEKHRHEEVLALIEGRYQI